MHTSTTRREVCDALGALDAAIRGVLEVDLQDADQAQQRITQVVRDSAADGILTLGTAGATQLADASEPEEPPQGTAPNCDFPSRPAGWFALSVRR